MSNDAPTTGGLQGQPLVSVIVCTYRRQEYLARAIASVLAGSYSNFEIIVSDNAASTDTRAIVESFHDSRIRYRANAVNLGIAGNHIAAFAEMRGDLFAVLNDDDEWEPEFLSAMVPPLSHDNLAVAFCDHFIMDEHGRIDTATSDENTRRWDRDRLPPGLHQPAIEIGLVRQSIPMVMGAVIRASAIDFSDFPAEVGQHYDLWLTYLALRTGMGAYYIPRRLVRYRVHSGAQTGVRVPEASAAAQYLYARLVADASLAEWQPVFRKRYIDAQITRGIELLYAGAAAEARSQLLVALRSEHSLRAGAALILSFAGGWAARGAIAAYGRVRKLRAPALVRHPDILSSERS